MQNQRLCYLPVTNEPMKFHIGRIACKQSPSAVLIIIRTHTNTEFQKRSDKLKKEVKLLNNMLCCQKPGFLV